MAPRSEREECPGGVRLLYVRDVDSVNVPVTREACFRLRERAKPSAPISPRNVNSSGDFDKGLLSSRGACAPFYWPPEDSSMRYEIGKILVETFSSLQLTNHGARVQAEGGFAITRDTAQILTFNIVYGLSFGYTHSLHLSQPALLLGRKDLPAYQVTAQQ